MKTIYLLLLTIGTIGVVNTAKAQAVINNSSNATPANPTDRYSTMNGTYFFQANPNQNMGTSPNNATFKNEPGFYNKDNHSNSNIFPTSNGQHYVPGSLGYNYNLNNSNNINTPGSDISNTRERTPAYINNNEPVRPAPVPR